MSKTQNKPILLEAKQKTPNKPQKSSNSRTAILVALLALILAGRNAFLMYQQEQNNPNVTLENKLQQLTQSTEQQLSNFSNLQAKQQADFDKLQVDLQTTVTNQANQINNILETLKNINFQDLNNVKIVENTQIFIELANQALVLAPNYSSSIAMLNQALTTLKKLDLPQSNLLRKAIQQDLTNLKQQNSQNEALQKLARLANLVEYLPLKAKVEQDQKKTNKKYDPLLDNQEKSTWQENLAKNAKELLKNFVTITKLNDNEFNLEQITPSQAKLLTNNLKLQLQLTTWYAMQGKQQFFENTLNNLENLLNKYFDTENIKVSNALQQITNLKQANITTKVTVLQSLGLAEQLHKDLLTLQASK